MVKEKTIDFRINPYIQETSVQIVLDVLVLITIFMVLMLAKFSLLVCIVVAIGYFILVLLFHYRVIIQALKDKKKQDYITEIVSVKGFKEEFSFIGDRLGHSYIRFFYPKDMRVCKYKIKVISDNGEEKKLRSVISSKRLLEFMMFDKQQIEILQVTYLKNSKILLHIDLVDEPVNFTGKSKKVIEKAIHGSNTSI